MTEFKMCQLTIDEEFRRLAQLRSQDDHAHLEESILRDGCTAPLCVWNGTILDGHQRYEICKRHRIPFKIACIFLRWREEAIAWICANQLARHNVPEESRWYLIGKRYEAEHRLSACAVTRNNRFMGNVENATAEKPFLRESANEIFERLGRQYHVHPRSMGNYGAYSRAIDFLLPIAPEMVSKVFSGQVKVSQMGVLRIARLSVLDIQRVSKLIMEAPDGRVSSEIYRMFPKRKNCSPLNTLRTLTKSVKDVPVYDPDAELLNIILTIPSWVSSMERVCSNADFAKATGHACEKLEEELSGLKSAADMMIQTMKGKRQ